MAQRRERAARRLYPPSLSSILAFTLTAMPRAVPIIPYPRPRRRRCRRDRSLKTLAPHGGPPPPPPPAGLTFLGVEALSVSGPGGEIEMNLKFDATPEAPLAGVAGADRAKWSARYQGTKYVGSLIGDVVFDTLYLQMTPAGAEAGATRFRTRIRRAIFPIRSGGFSRRSRGSRCRGGAIAMTKCANDQLMSKCQ